MAKMHGIKAPSEKSNFHRAGTVKCTTDTGKANNDGGVTAGNTGCRMIKNKGAKTMFKTKLPVIASWLS